MQLNCKCLMEAYRSHSTIFVGLAFNMTVSSKQAAYVGDIKGHLSDEVESIFTLGLVTIDSTARLLDFEHLYSFLL